MARFPRIFGRAAVAKVAQPIAAQTPPAIEQAMAAQGMDSSAQLGPGRPINPAWGYSTRARAMDYPVGVNIGTGSRRAAWGRTSYDVIRGLINSYSVARICINHKIDELRSMEPLFQPADGISYDVEAALDAARAALARPDRVHPYEAWLSMWLEVVLGYDAGHLARRRNYDGQVMGLEVIDGTTLTPLVDEYGRQPEPPAPAWQQIIKGLPAKDFTADDLIPTIYRPQPDSPFGLAPIESIILTVNTDIRLQWHFLQMFTEGSVPAGFIEVPPDVSSPDQVDEWQQYWDATVMGDQAKQHQLIAVPNGTKVNQTRPAAFDKAFPEWLAVQTAMAFGVVPQDLGLTMDVNRATGETQTDVQFRVNTLPWVRFVEGTLTRYLQDDLGLPVQLKLDTGREKEDRYQEAQAWQIYVNTGAASVDEMREELLGLPTDNERPVPRFVLDPRTGPVPIRSIEAIAGPVDPETKAPAEDQPLDTTPYDGAGGVLPYKMPGGLQFHRAPTDPDDPRRPELEQPVPGSDTAGLAQPAGAAPVAKAAEEELAAFRRFVKAQQKAGRWRRDFEFTAVDPAPARNLNRHARARVRKASGEVAVAGLAVVAADTGRVLMLQRAMDPADPAAGCWEFPGGHIEAGEAPSDAAGREWAEETGLTLPDGDTYMSWVSGSGVYQGYVYVIPEESALPIFDRADGTNPDDPGGDQIEALAWWDPGTVDGNPAIRPELQSGWEQVLAIIESAVSQGKAPGPVAKSWRDGPDTHLIHRFDLRITDHYRPLIEAALAALFTQAQLRTAIEAARSAARGAVQKDAESDLRHRVAQAARDALAAGAATGDLESAIRGIIVDGYLTGGWAAAQQLPADSGAPVTLAGVGSIDWGAWQPGHVDAAIQTADGALADALANAGVTVKGIVGTTLDRLGDAIADGLLDGASVDSIGRSLRPIIGPLGPDATRGERKALADRAEMISHTETARAQTNAAMNVYRLNGIAEWDLITSSGACQVCLDIAAANPHPVGDSGDQPPLHPRCRCSASPHVTW